MTQNEIELRVRDVRERPNRHVAEVDRIGDSGICGSHSRLGEHLVGDVAQDHRTAQSRPPHRYVPGSTSGVEDAGDRNQTVVGLDPARPIHQLICPDAERTQPESRIEGSANNAAILGLAAGGRSSTC